MVYLSKYLSIGEFSILGISVGYIPEYREFFVAGLIAFSVLDGVISIRASWLKVLMKAYVRKFRRSELDRVFEKIFDAPSNNPFLGDVEVHSYSFPARGVLIFQLTKILLLLTGIAIFILYYGIYIMLLVEIWNEPNFLNSMGDWIVIAAILTSISIILALHHIDIPIPLYRYHWLKRYNEYTEAGETKKAERLAKVYSVMRANKSSHRWASK